MVVVITAREVGKPSRLKHRATASRAVPDCAAEAVYSGKIYMQ